MPTNLAPRNAEHTFTVVSTKVTRSSELRAIEKTLLTYLIGKPDGWQPDANQIKNEMAEGIYAIRQGLKRLKELGYLVCHTVRDKLGRFIRTDWTINEIPVPPAGAKLDVYGNVIIFDNAKARPKNLRQEAKTKASSTTKSRVKKVHKPPLKTRSETSASIDFDPYAGFPHAGNCTGSNIDRRNTDLKILEREGGGARVEEVPPENNTQQAEVLEPGNGLKQAGVEQAETFHTLLTKEESGTSAKTKGLDQFSATVALGKFNVEADWDKAESVKYNQAEVLEFKAQLEDLGKRLGKRNPVAWAYVIVKNLKTTPSTYWEDFKAGRVLGASEQHEWEILPGVPCQVAIQCLEQDYLGTPGTTQTQAALRAARTIANPAQMRIVWESMKNRVLFQKQEHDRQQALGIEHPATMESWMKPRPKAKIEDVASALQEMHANLPLVLQPVQEPWTQGILPEPAVTEVVAEDERAITGTADCAGNERAIVENPVEETVAEVKEEIVDPDVVAAAKAKIAGMLKKFEGLQLRGKRGSSILKVNTVELETEIKPEPKPEPVTPPMEELQSDFEGVAGYLRDLEARNEDEIW
jgi:hypothetical protein